MAQTTSPFSEIEESVQKLWNSEKTFEKSVKNREGQPLFSFYDGPPFANGLPHFGHSLVTSIKDATLRYKTMRGFYVPRRNGWDCHGLPVEFAVEKELGVNGKKQIMALGLENFNAACRASIFKYKDDWEHLLQRLGRWSDYEHFYATVDTSYTESVWWALSQIHKKNLLYKGYKSSPYCPRCETPLSNFEVNEGYKDNVADPSLYVKFKLTDEDAALLAWTTTPWSLPGNAALAINPKENYLYVSYTDDDGQNDTIILAKSRLSVVDEQDYKIIKEVAATGLIGKSYQPLFPEAAQGDDKFSDNLYKVWGAEFVSTEDGTGVLHVAPAFGEDDLNLSQKHNIPVLVTIDKSGHVTSGIGLTEVEGKFFKSADRPIIEYLSEGGHVFAAETTLHTYPFCWRCETPLLYYAIDSWFIKVSSIQADLVKTAEGINWVPAHIKQGRFGKWLSGARDWAISRNRYWGAPLPIWVNERDASDYIVVASIAELKELAGPDIKVDDLHRPFIDKISFTQDGKKYRRVDEVLDCWFESGCMSFAQYHYPFENKQAFKQSFPADFIIEGLDQTRLWFYVQHVVNTILFNAPAYQNVVVNGIILAADGQKLSKRLKNYPPLDEVFESEGADSLRLLLLSSTQATQTADYMRFNLDGLKDLNRNVLGTLMNTYRFFSMYAEIDGWKLPKTLTTPKSTNVLDQWLLARLNETVMTVTKQADDYKIAHAIEPIFALIDDTSNWYVRRSRRRFWKSEDDVDKRDAYASLHFVLVRTMQLLAPWAPFISDYLWRQLTAGMNEPTSVHLSDWPTVENVDKKLIQTMADLKDIITVGLSQRAEAGIKVRQPLADLALSPQYNFGNEFTEILKDELNVKSILWRDGQPKLNTKLSDKLKAEGNMRELVRHIQNARKTAGLQVEDRINLILSTKDKGLQAIVTNYKSIIQKETLAKKILTEGTYKYQTEVTIDGKNLTINLQKSDQVLDV
jgi:isoleucyl-tRNA synthetase